jgi:LmbE family N-acetylglucosaminyl deacetylase
VKAFDLDPQLRWLFCMTHPDDEIAICAWIRRLVRNGNEVYVSWTHSNPVREGEARAVALLLGVPLDHLIFFGATDGGACDEIPELLPRFRQMMDTVQPDRVVCGAFEQGHVDHDTTNYLVNKAFDGPVFEIPLYHTYRRRLQRLNRFSSRDGEELYELTPDERRLKITIARQYPSQNIWGVLFWYDAVHKALLRPQRLLKAERMRVQTHHRFLVPNHPPHLAERVARCPAWTRWVSAVLAAEARLLVGEAPQETPLDKAIR